MCKSIGQVAYEAWLSNMPVVQFSWDTLPMSSRIGWQRIAEEIVAFHSSHAPKPPPSDKDWLKHG